MRLLALFLALTITGCSAQWHLAKAVKKDPTILVQDTVQVTDTIVIPPIELTDTVVLKDIDTVVFEKDRVRVQLLRKYDTIHVDAICDTDTVISYVEVPVEKVVYKERGFSLSFWERVFLGAIIGLIIVKVVSNWLSFRSQ